jgi:hypothetical protein
LRDRSAAVRSQLGQLRYSSFATGASVSGGAVQDRTELISVKHPYSINPDNQTLPVPAYLRG